jgi:hypothetical protein
MALVLPSPTPDVGTALAAELAARIQIPAWLPVRSDGEPIKHLSKSSYELFVRCPDAWRRRYIGLEREPPGR